MGGRLSTAGAAALLGAILALAGLTSVFGASSKKTNEMPVANAGFDQTVSLGEIVVLDGSTSTDVDGGRLRFSWQLVSTPAGSSAALSDPAAVKPSLVVDEPGDFVVQLIVIELLKGGKDELESLPDFVTISTENSRPVADAGDRTVTQGSIHQLNGGGSSDPDGDLLSFNWSLISVPAGSAADISDPAAVRPAFEVDVSGSYVAQLVVHDGRSDSDPDTVTISTENSAPEANAGPDQTAAVGETVQLDGSFSFDADGDALLFKWALIHRPLGSNDLDNRISSRPTLSVDLPGTYIAQLVCALPQHHQQTIQPAPDLSVYRHQKQPLNMQSLLIQHQLF